MDLVRDEGEEPSRPQGVRRDGLHEDVVDSAPQKEDGRSHGEHSDESAGRAESRELGRELLKSVPPRRELLAHVLRHFSFYPLY